LKKDSKVKVTSGAQIAKKMDIPKENAGDDQRVSFSTIELFAVWQLI
jgi:hypothetical protein